MLVVDAFNSDAIPIHLLTAEAFDLYLSHMRDAENGLIAFHVSNRSLDLIPVVHGLAQPRGFRSVLVIDPGQMLREGTIQSKWVVVTKDKSFASTPQLQTAIDGDLPADMKSIAWTDDFASLWSVMGTGRNPHTAGRWSQAPGAGQMVIDDARLMTEEDQAHALFVARRLYLDTGGLCALCVITVKDWRGLNSAAVAGGVAFEDYINQEYNDLGLNRTPANRGVLLLAAVEEGRVVVLAGTGWSGANREAFETVKKSVIMPQLKADKNSKALRAGVVELANLMRTIIEKEERRPRR